MTETSFFQPGVVAIIVLTTMPIYECVEFHRGTSGVVFSAYVKRNENGVLPSWKTYSLEDLKTMLKVISSKFTRVVTFGVGADIITYEMGITYKRSNAQIMSAEAAAAINREKRVRNLSMIVGMWLSDSPQQTRTEVQLALESAELANSIFNGTVEGFVFAQVDMQASLQHSRQCLEQMRFMRSQTSLKIGSRQKCYGMSGDVAADELSMIRREIVNASDFIICDIMPLDQSSGAENGFGTVHSDLLRFRRDLKSINPRIEVMGETGWPHAGSNPWETPENMEKYWRVANAFGEEQNFTMIMNEAFDTPWNNWAAYNGWWRLRKNSLVGRLNGYADNIAEPLGEESIDGNGISATGIWIYVSLAIGLIIVVAILSAVAFLFFRIRKLQNALTRKDVREFLYGLSEEAAIQQGGDDVVPSALKTPYDRSYEIRKENLKIRKDVLLGSGQFGCVYKALIKIENDKQIEVALKMAKSNCPRNALVGLLSEIKILIYLGKHANIVSILGAYTAELSKGIVYVATELCSHGSLKSYLEQHPFHQTDDRYENIMIIDPSYDNASNITIVNMVRWSYEIACGMEYLGAKHIVHADLATRNVLLGANKTAKITDFGLSSRLYDYANTNYVTKEGGPLPWRWMAIESLKRNKFSEESDVWSYGITLWEIFSMGDSPYPGLNWSLGFINFLMGGLRLRSPTYATPEIYDIMVRCWNMDPMKRPTFKSLKRSTLHVLETISGSAVDRSKS